MDYLFFCGLYGNIKHVSWFKAAQQLLKEIKSTQANKTKLKKKNTTSAFQKMIAIIKIQQYHQVAYQHQEHLLPLPYQYRHLTETSIKSNTRC